MFYLTNFTSPSKQFRIKIKNALRHMRYIQLPTLEIEPHKIAETVHSLFNLVCHCIATLHNGQKNAGLQRISLF